MPKKKSEPHDHDTRLEVLFRQLGLSDKQARIYSVLLTKKTAQASYISQKSGVNRSNVYVLLKDLMKRGLVDEVGKKGISYFQAAPPSRLVEMVESREKDIMAAKQLAQDLAPRLTQQWKNSIGKPLIRYFEGEEGLKQVFEDIYAPKSEPVYGGIDVDKIEEFSEGFSEGVLIPTRDKHSLAVKVLFNDTPYAYKLHKRDVQDNRESILLDKEKYPLPAEIESYGNTVALMSFKKGDFIGLLIENEDFAVSLRSILKFLFDHMRTCKSTDDSSAS